MLKLVPIYTTLFRILISGGYSNRSLLKTVLERFLFFLNFNHNYNFEHKQINTYLIRRNFKVDYLNDLVKFGDYHRMIKFTL